MNNISNYQLFIQLQRDVQLRKKLLEWYQFKEDAILLDVSPTTSYLSVFLAEKVKEVHCLVDSHEQLEFLKGMNGSIENIKYIFSNQIVQKYDYVIAITPFFFEYDELIFQKYHNWSTYLNEQGVFLLAIDNKFSATNSLRIINTDKRLHTLDVDKSYLSHLYSNIKTYYIYPDLLVIQDIYTDEYLPPKEIGGNHIPYALNNEQLSYGTYRNYKDSFYCENPQKLAGAFLIECSLSDKSFVDDVLRVKLTPQRGKYGTTTILKKNSVEKIANEPSVKNLRQLKSNLTDLEQRGIHVVSSEIQDDRLIMPRLFYQNLMDKIVEACQTDKRSLCHLMDQLYELILLSSNHVNESAYWNEKYGNYDWGIILEKGYVEMGPLNIFYDGENYIFYDQEYVLENCPAKFIIYRAIEHIRIHLSEKNWIISIEELFSRYGISSELNKIFYQEELNFLKSISEENTVSNFLESHQLLASNRLGYMTTAELDYLFRNLGTKKFICYGTEKFVQHFIKNYGKILPIEFVVLNHSHNLGNTIENIPISDIKKIDNNKHRVVLSELQSKNILIDLIKYGINDYKLIYYK